MAAMKTSPELGTPPALAAAPAPAQQQLEPDELWKSEMKKRIDANLEELLKDARLTYEQKVDATGPREEERRGELYYDYLQAVQDLRSWARDEYAGALERERKEIEWCRESGAEVPVGFVDEAQKEEQYLMLDAFRRMTEARLGGSRPVEEGYEYDLEYAPPSLAAGCGAAVMSFSEPGTPIQSSVLDEHYYRQAEELSRLLSATPSPPPSPAPSHLGLSSPEMADESLLMSSSSLTSPDLSPSPPATPALSSAEETDESGVSSAESSVIFTPPQRSESVLSSAESSIIFTPERSVIDEEIRLKAEKHAEQQEEFRRRAEGIKKSVMQRKVLRQLEQEQGKKAQKEVKLIADAPAAVASTAVAVVPRSVGSLLSKYPSAPPSTSGYPSAPPSATRERFHWSSAYSSASSDGFSPPPAPAATLRDHQPYMYRGYTQSASSTPPASTGRRTGTSTPADYTPYIFPESLPPSPQPMISRPLSSASAAAANNISFSGFHSSSNSAVKASSASASASASGYSSFSREPTSFSSFSASSFAASATSSQSATPTPTPVPMSRASRSSYASTHTISTPSTFTNTSSASASAYSVISSSTFTNPSTTPKPKPKTTSASSQSSHTTRTAKPVSQMSQEDMMRIFIFHDQQWMRITQLSAFPVLHFGDFPWPLLSFGAPRGVGELGVEGVEGYMFGAFGICREDLQKYRQRQGGKGGGALSYEEEEKEVAVVRTKERVREHMKKWSCSERFENVFLKRVPEEGGEREMVRKGAALVVAHLNEILGRFE